MQKLVNSSIYTIHHQFFLNHSSKKKKKKKKRISNTPKSDRHSFDILRSRSGRGALKVITKALSREASPANLIPRGREGGGESHFLLSVPQDSSDGWEKGHRMALSSGSPVSEDVWVLIKMCRASGDATPTSTTTPSPLFLLLHSLLPSVHGFLSFHDPAFSLHFPSPPLPSQTLHASSNFFSTPLALARCLRAIARKENRNIEVEPRECHLDDSCRFVHTYTLSLFLPLPFSLCLSERTHAEDVSSLPADPGGSVFLPANS